MAEYYVSIERGTTGTMSRVAEGKTIYFNDDEEGARSVLEALRAVLKMAEDIYAEARDSLDEGE